MHLFLRMRIHKFSATLVEAAQSDESVAAYLLFWKSKNVWWVCLIILNIVMLLFEERCDEWNNLRMLGDSPSAITIRQCLVYANEKVIKITENFSSWKFFLENRQSVFYENLIFECCIFEYWNIIQFPPLFSIFF